MLPIITKQIAFNTSKRTKKIEYIIIHDTSNRKFSAGAEAHYTYFNGGDRQSSADFFIDDKNIICLNDYMNRYTYAVGDGAGKYGITNNNSVSVELCINEDSDYETAYNNMVDLVKWLAKELRLGYDKVVRHFDASKKVCPKTMSDNDWQKWKEFKKLLIPKSTPVVSQVTIANNQFKVISDKLNVRKSPSLWSFIIGKFIKGDIVYSEGSSGGWVKCKIWDGSYGYVKAEYLEEVKGAAAPMSKTYEENGIYFREIPVEEFKILYWDKPKQTNEYSNYANFGYFAKYDEDGVSFTLPVANLVADIDESKISEVALKYLRERKILNGKFYMNCDQNASDQFKGKSVSTLVIDENGAHIAKYNSLNDNVRYAVSGAPIILNGQDPSWKNDISPEGWDTSIARATWHGFITVKDNKIIYMAIETKTANCFTSSEVYNKLKGYGFDTVLKIDGGGSFIYVSDENKKETSENRQINNILKF